jgi:hypothetical protein
VGKEAFFNPLSPFSDIYSRHRIETEILNATEERRDAITLVFAVLYFLEKRKAEKHKRDNIRERQLKAPVLFNVLLMVRSCAKQMGNEIM